MKVELKNIHFSYGQIKALNGINLVLNEGATGLLGPEWGWKKHSAQNYAGVSYSG